MYETLVALEDSELSEVRGGWGGGGWGGGCCGGEFERGCCGEEEFGCCFRRRRRCCEFEECCD